MMTGFAYEKKEKHKKRKNKSICDNYITQNKISDRSLVVKQEL